CATHPERDLIIGGAGKVIAAGGKYAKRAMDTFQETLQWRQSQKDEPTRGRDADILRKPSGELAERGGYGGHVMESSLYTKASMHPLITAASVVGAGLAVAALIGATAAGEPESRAEQWKHWASRRARAATRTAKG